MARLLVLIVRAIAVWGLFILVESAQGALRRAIFGADMPLVVRELSVGSGVLVSFLLAWLCGRWMRLRSQADALAVGALWTALTVSFEAALGALTGAPWATAADYDPRRGGLMALGLLAVALAPWLAQRLRQRRALLDPPQGSNSASGVQSSR